ncbi:hypothetical protein [Anaerotalea alkaliphila]|uniref:Uncharacterized protein n=1 Tax=Anaerotalea alkaliphila TaxID=2662126 RepID=A0A7X5KMB4_9FIRM|nr:hypothetical protein [Anaerotalea alkaliphila]NDL67624.1 hypothetical protein [Anaerotalea alkaliphila]
MIPLKKVYFDPWILPRSYGDILRQIRNGSPRARRYIRIVVRGTGKNLMEMVSYREVRRLEEQGEDIYLLGVLLPRPGDSAHRLVERILQDWVGIAPDLEKEAVFRGIGVRIHGN